MKKQTLFILIGIFFLNFAFCNVRPGEGKSLAINIISYRNGVGLDQDIDILVRELTNLGHKVSLWHYRKHKKRPEVDINLFIEVVDTYHLKYAKKNYFAINPEWYLDDAKTLRDFDKILCKTREAERVLKQYTPKAVYMGFTCQDRYDPSIEKNYKLPLHLVGASMQKNTPMVVKTWQDNPQLPLLTIAKHRGPWEYPPIDNIDIIYRYLTFEEMIYKQNHYGLQICPSCTEGFGHYIVEALGCSNVVVTLDAPPMNEFVKDQRCLVKPSRKGRHALADVYYAEPDELAKVVEDLLALPDEELRQIGEKNREFFLENIKEFRRNLAKIFPPANGVDLEKFIEGHE